MKKVNIIIKNKLDIIENLCVDKIFVDNSWRMLLFQNKNEFDSVIISNFDTGLNIESQRTLLTKLVNHNNKTTFYICTDSPFVVQSAEGYDIVEINNNELVYTPIIVGASITYILNLYFDFNDQIYSVNVEKQITEFKDLLDKKRIELTETEDKKLNKLIKYLYTLPETVKNIVSREIRQFERLTNKQ